MKNEKWDMEKSVQHIMRILTAQGICARYDKDKNEIITDNGQIIVPVIAELQSDNKSKEFFDILRTHNYSMRNTIDEFVYQNGYYEFLEIKKMLEEDSCFLAIYADLHEAIWTKTENSSHVITENGIFNLLNLQFNGTNVDVPEVYIETFPEETQYIFALS
ncbi:hypothetical protein [Pelosinus propionicus]|uniref:Uncharacterized protein n=1 Tax=Pelosinus propionicus DSM 13327 TaxID=1123291 RepID=A0A1I4PL55_9FIRM|nr:hypothetical protein [Pelosinus propionicus]SFM28354.1 hypothetical protein SAMN04490355_106615 [Pelosinus propionicus DSM 13327]